MSLLGTVAISATVDGTVFIGSLLWMYRERSGNGMLVYTSQGTNAVLVNEGAEQHAHPRRLTGIFAWRSAGVAKDRSCRQSRLWLDCVDVQADWVFTIRIWLCRFCCALANDRQTWSVNYGINFQRRLAHYSSKVGFRNKLVRAQHYLWTNVRSCVENSFFNGRGNQVYASAIGV